MQPRSFKMEHHRTLKITLQYANDLHKANLFSKMDVYALVSISGGDKRSAQETRTPSDPAGGRNPSWCFPMKFTVEEAALQQNLLFLDFKLVCKRTLGDKEVGEAQVPIKELLLDSTRARKGKKFVSYQVMKPSGKAKGHLTFSYQFVDVAVAEVGPTAALPPSWFYPLMVVAAERGGGYYLPATDAGCGYPPFPTVGVGPPSKQTAGCLGKDICPALPRTTSTTTS